MKVVEHCSQYCSQCGTPVRVVGMGDFIGDPLEKAITLHYEPLYSFDDVKALARAADMLVAEQNGPPLVRDAGTWKAAMDAIAEALKPFVALLEEKKA